MKEVEAAEQAMCTRCKWLDEEELICDAYPSGIPVEILRGVVIHNKVQDYQTGDFIFTRRAS